MTPEPVETADLAAAEQPRALLFRHAKEMMAASGGIIARLFYVQLLRRHPRMAALFAASDLEQQAGALAAMLQMVIEYADEPQKLGSSAISLGVAHASRGLVRKDYADFNQALAEVLAEWQSVVPADVARRIWLHELNAVTDIMQIVGAQ